MGNTEDLCVPELDRPWAGHFALLPLHKVNSISLKSSPPWLSNCQYRLLSGFVTCFSNPTWKVLDPTWQGVQLRNFLPSEISVIRGIDIEAQSGPGEKLLYYSPGKLLLIFFLSFKHLEFTECIFFQGISPLCFSPCLEWLGVWKGKKIVLQVCKGI